MTLGDIFFLYFLPPGTCSHWSPKSELMDQKGQDEDDTHRSSYFPPASGGRLKWAMPGLWRGLLHGGHTGGSDIEQMGTQGNGLGLAGLAGLAGGLDGDGDGKPWVGVGESGVGVGSGSKIKKIRG